MRTPPPPPTPRGGASAASTESRADGSAGDEDGGAADDSPARPPRTGGSAVEASPTRATLLFTDIRGFTALTERLGPADTARLLTAYFALLVDCLDRHGGRPETFFGDSMLASFTADAAEDNGADAAVQAAITIRINLAAWNRRRAADGLPDVDMGIGINTGDFLYSRLGLPAGVAATPIGSGVNVAARLEAACKPYGAKILVSGATFRRLMRPYASRLVDTTILEGVRRPIEIHEILDYHTEETFPNLADALRSFSDGVACYRCQRFKDAIKAFRNALSFNPRDRLTRHYIDRCQRLLRSPPSADWSAIWAGT